MAAGAPALTHRSQRQPGHNLRELEAVGLRVAQRHGVDGDTYVSGSGTLVRALLADGLVDELHLLVYPLALGAGPRLFPESAPKPPWPWAAPRPSATAWRTRPTYLPVAG
jgi:dihydrofolate reductase